jgi:hypothetical protein
MTVERVALLLLFAAAIGLCTAGGVWLHLWIKRPLHQQWGVTRLKPRVVVPVAGLAGFFVVLVPLLWRLP